MGMEELLKELEANKGMTVPSISQSSMTVYFKQEIVDYLTQNKAYAKRVLRDIAKYGYAGGSKGGVNGILNIHPIRDGNLAERVGHFVGNGRCEKIISEYSLNKENLKGVKVVVHDRTGRRIIGVMDEPNKKIVLYEVSNYKR